MATYEYQCSAAGCRAVNERIQPMADPLPESVPCCFCGEPAPYKFSLPALAHSGSTASKTPHDVAVGRDAAARWSSIDQRQGERDKVRRASGQVGLAADRWNHFRPVTDEQRQQRARARGAVERDGYRPG